MTLHESIKDALRKGWSPQEVASFFGVSVMLVEKIKSGMKP